MSNQENDKLIESAFERFLWEYETIPSFRYYIQEYFFTDEELWREKELNHPEEALIRVFYLLFEADFEACCIDIVRFALNYKCYIKK